MENKFPKSISAKELNQEKNLCGNGQGKVVKIRITTPETSYIGLVTIK